MSEPFAEAWRGSFADATYRITLEPIIDARFPKLRLERLVSQEGQPEEWQVVFED